MRYSSRAFPPYRYTPGKNPHPVISEQGHSYGHDDPDFQRDSAAAQAHFDYGLDLINHAYFWEAHEVFEFLWKQWPRDSREARILQALILVAVSQLHGRRGKNATAIKVAAMGLEKIAGIKGGYRRLAVLDIQRALEQVKARGELVDDLFIPIHVDPN
ncbi:MAG: DUF309 domain-containing protein [Planctomycetes bacterium]|nr:DUF309 domain-containing protein [Planctomycetota bacterium]